MTKKSKNKKPIFSKSNLIPLQKLGLIFLTISLLFILLMSYTRSFGEYVFHWGTTEYDEILVEPYEPVPTDEAPDADADYYYINSEPEMWGSFIISIRYLRQDKDCGGSVPFIIPILPVEGLLLTPSESKPDVGSLTDLGEFSFSIIDDANSEYQEYQKALFAERDPIIPLWYGDDSLVAISIFLTAATLVFLIVLFNSKNKKGHRFYSVLLILAASAAGTSATIPGFVVALLIVIQIIWLWIHDNFLKKNKIKNLINEKSNAK